MTIETFNLALPLVNKINEIDNSILELGKILERPTLGEFRMGSTMISLPPQTMRGQIKKKITDLNIERDNLVNQLSMI